MRIFPLLLIFLAGSASAAPIEPLQPLSYLAGHCWKGSIPATASTDEHCFEWVLGGQVLRDTHTVRTAGKTDYRGETTYFWSDITKSVEYIYLDSRGGISRGLMETVANTLAFPPAEHVPGDAAAVYRVRWTPSGTNAYDSWAEKKGPDGTWQTMFKMTMTKMKPKAKAKAKAKSRTRR
jgi:hypothetical protein